MKATIQFHHQFGQYQKHCPQDTHQWPLPLPQQETLNDSTENAFQHKFVEEDSSMNGSEDATIHPSASHQCNIDGH